MANQHTAIPWPERFWSKTKRSDNGCIEWTASTDGRGGYGKISFPGYGLGYAHRIAFFMHHGRWPKSEIDHVCRNRKCVNVDHLRETDRIGNMSNGTWALATHCIHGHPFDESNTYSYVRQRKTGIGRQRQCKACVRENGRRRKIQAGMERTAHPSQKRPASSK